jgi:hypothetical protein
MKNVLKNSFLLLLALFIVSSSCKKKEPAPPPFIDNRIIGTWQCEGLFCINKPDSLFDSNMDTTYSKIYKNKKIVLTISEGYTIMIDNYPWDIIGTLRLISNTNCNLNMSELKDLLNRPQSDYQPIFVEKLNAANNYWVEGNGNSYSKLYFYFNNQNWVARFTKQ